MSKSAFHVFYRSINVEIDPKIAIAGVLFPSIFNSPMQKRLRETPDFNSLDIFKSFLAEGKLHPTENIAEFVKKVLLKSSDKDFKGIEWDYDNQEHHRILDT